MDTLLAAIKKQLQDDDDLSYIRDSDIYITPDTLYIPAGKALPCIGIKDGDITREELISDVWQVKLSVSISVYVEILRDEATIIGDEATEKKGILQIVSDINTSLDQNLLDITGMQAAVSPSETASGVFEKDNRLLSMKTINFEYVQEINR